MIKIAPSVLSADFLNLEKEIRSIEESGADLVHLDIMDGNFVPNITFGPMIVKQIRKVTTLPFDTHLMIKNPTLFAPLFIEAGCDIITVHAETETHLHRTLQLIKNHGAKAGISVNPHTPVDFLKYCGEMCDLFLVMSVNPGFGGQNYIESATKKIAKVKEIREKYNFNFEISVDGGVNNETVSKVCQAGADIAVMGSHFFGTPIEKRKELIENIKNNL
ncbi:MAG: ribulose-phosphate 3-epimerase [bacterium]